MAETAAFAELYRLHAADVLKFLRRNLLDDASAQDLLQDAFLNFFRHYKTKELPAPLACRMILFRAARNLMINHANQYYRRNVTIEPSSTMEGLARTTHGAEDAALQKMDAIRVRETLNQAMKQLPEVERTALILRHEHSCRLEEIGDVLGLSPSGASRMIDRAEKKLGQLCKELGLDPAEVRG